MTCSSKMHVSRFIYHYCVNRAATNVDIVEIRELKATESRKDHFQNIYPLILYYKQIYFSYQTHIKCAFCANAMQEQFYNWSYLVFLHHQHTFCFHQFSNSIKYVDCLFHYKILLINQKSLNLAFD